MLSLENLQSAFEASPAAFLILYPDTPRFTIAGVNGAFLELTNTTRLVILGKSIFEAFPETPDGIGSKRRNTMRSSLEQVLLKKTHSISLQRYELPGDRSGNSHDILFWNCDIFPVLDENNEARFIVQNLVDVTNVIRTIEDQNVRLREIAWEQSHLVRAPLARIMGLSNLISEERSDVKQLLLHIDQSAKELDVIIKNIIKKTEGIDSNSPARIVNWFL